MVEELVAFIPGVRGGEPLFWAIPFVLVLCPFLIKNLSGKGWKMWIQICISIILVWVAMLAYRLLVVFPEISAQRDPVNDGVAGNAVVLMLGWLGGISYTLPFALIRIVLELLRGSAKARGA